MFVHRFLTDMNYKDPHESRVLLSEMEISLPLNIKLKSKPKSLVLSEAEML